MHNRKTTHQSIAVLRHLVAGCSHCSRYQTTQIRSIARFGSIAMGAFAMPINQQFALTAGSPSSVLPGLMVIPALRSKPSASRLMTRIMC